MTSRHTVLFVHGFLDAPSFWDSVAAALRPPTLAVDLRDTDRADLRGYTQLVVKSAADAATERIVLVGHSMGAQIAELAAANLGGRVAGLALLSPIPLAGMDLPPELATALRTCGGDREAQRVLRAQLASNLSATDMERVLDTGMRYPPAEVADMFDAWRHGLPDKGSAPADFTGPVTIATGACDPFVTVDLVRSAIAPRFADAPVTAVEDSGHWPAIEQPARVAAVLTRFLQAIP